MDLFVLLDVEFNCLSESASIDKNTESLHIYILICYWMALSLCPSAIETTFPLSNFKTKHIFGILMTRRKFLKLWGATGAP